MSHNFQDQFYSNIIVYDERKRYYYLWARKNKPILDDEIRNSQLAIVDQVRRSLQHTQGDVSVPLATYSRSKTSNVSNYFGVRGNGANDIRVIGGTSVESPAVMFIKGFYVFLTNDVVYSQQDDTGNITDADFTETQIPDLTTPVAGNGDRIDIVYVDLHFGEVSPLDSTEYKDENLKNPIVGTETANRLRAVFDIRVWEDYPNKDIEGNARVNIPNINEDIFTSTDFLGSLPTNDFDANPLYKEHLRVPIAILYRKEGIASITDDNIIDLLSLYDKRVLTLEEITYRSRHGGYGETAVYELMLQSGQAGFTGLASPTGGVQARFPYAKLDEGAYATGLNQGFEPQAFNTDSVTPRALDSDGKFAMGSLLVGREDSDKTYPVTSETGPVDLADGEAMANQISAKSIYVGYDRGITGIREYSDRMNIHMQGLTGTAGLRIINETGETGTLTAHLKGKAGPTENNTYVDFLGRIGINTSYPGWTAVNTLWNTSGDNIVLDVNDSVRIWRNQFIKGDHYVEGGSFGQSWQLPSYPSGYTPGMVGFTGVANQISGVVPTDDEGITGRAAIYVKPGIAVVGSQNIPGYTGNFGFYEAFDSDGGRVFTIGSLGEDFDRTVRSLFGVGFRTLFLTDYSLLYLPSGYGQITGGDTITVSGVDYDGNVVTPGSPYTMSSTIGLTGVYEFGQYLVSNFPQTKAQVILDPFDEAKDPADRAETHGQLIIKDLEDRSSFHINSFTLNRSWATPSSINVSWTESKFFGSGTFGGDVLDLKFAKLDLGEAADAWLFNGDVFFNGIGELNRVTFSPNVLFRNDVFVYGNFVADSLLFNYAKVNNMQVNNQLKVDDDVAIGEHLVVGYDLNQAFSKLNVQTNTNENLTFLNNGDIMSEKFIAQTTKDADDADVNEYGSFQSQTRSFGYDINLKIGGTFGSTEDPLGVHLIDSRFGITLNSGNSPDTIVFDYSNGSGEYGTLNLRVRGNLRATEGIVAANVSAGETLTEPNTDYSLFVSGDSRINGTLTVEQIKYTGSAAAEDDGIITTPPNVNVIEREQQFVIPPQGDILRTKKFSLSTKALLNNKGSFDLNLCGAEIAPYEVNTGSVFQSTPPSISEVEVVSDSARFAHDNLTYTQEAFAGHYTETATTELIASQFTSASFEQIPELFRRNFDRITIATLGTLRATYVGFVQGTDYGISNQSRTDRYPGNIVQNYEFESRYFRNKSGGSIINWLPSSGGVTSARFGDENLLAKVEADIIGTNPDRPDIYHLDKPIAIFLPLTSWERYCIRYPDTANSYTYSLYYPVEYVIQNFTKLDFEKQTSFSTEGDTWYLGLYPELNNITSVAFSDSNSDRLYRAEWDLNLVVYSEEIGKCSNLIGNINVSYMQG
jgi:hypothetical protein